MGRLGGAAQRCAAAIDAAIVGERVARFCVQRGVGCLLHDLRSARPLHERLGLAPTHRLALAQSVDLARFAQASHAPSAG